VNSPFGYRLFHQFLNVTGAAQENRRGLAARLARGSVIAGVHALQRVHSLEFPARAVGGFWWIWRWRLEFLMEWFEWESVVWARRLIRQGMTVLDLGAHIGYYSRIFSRLVGPRGKVFAFEPNPENLYILRRNLSAPRYQNVEILPYAVSDRSETRKLYVSPGHSNHSLIRGFSQAEEEIDVRTVSIDAFLDGKDAAKVDFVKMDLEGSESAALLGMRETIRQSPAMSLLVEYNPLALRAAGTTPEAFLQLLDRLGLHSEAILDDASLGPVPDVSRGDLQNLLCSKAGDSRWPC